ncbi:mCG146103, partial [Mus musculus]
GDGEICSTQSTATFSKSQTPWAARTSCLSCSLSASQLFKDNKGTHRSSHSEPRHFLLFEPQTQGALILALLHSWEN